MAKNELTLTIKGETSQLLAALNKAGFAIDKFTKKSGDSGDKTKNAFSGISGAVSVAAGNLISAGIHKAFDMINNSVDGAIRRVDILNNFPKVMSNLGISADDSKKAITRMADALRGLPTSLDSAAASVQRLTSKNGDVGKSTEMFLALNNAILAGGAPMDIQATAIEQISQAYAKGKPDMMEWRALQSAMPAQLKQIAQAFFQNGSAIDEYLKKAEEYAKKNPMSSTGKELVDQLTAVKNGTGDMTTALGTAMRTGIVSMDDFMNTLTKMNKEGVNGFQSFEQQARNSTGGIQTAIENSKTAVVRGIAKIIEAFGSGSLAETVSGLGSGFEKALDSVAGLIKFVKDNSAVFTVIAVGVGVFTGAVVAYNTAVWLASAASKAWTVATQIATGVQWLFNAALNANPLTLLVVAIAAVVAGIVWFFTQTETGKNIWNGFVEVLSSTISSIGQWFKGLWDGIVSIFSGVAGWFGGIFQGAWNAITGIFGRLGGFFGGVWNSITGMFGRLGSFVGDAIGGAVKGAVNGALGMVERMANGFIGMINGAIGLINKIPGVNIGNIPSLHLPRLATGGIVTPQGGGSIIYAGDGGQNEWVVPESKMASLVEQINRRRSGDGGMTKHITVNNTYNVRDKVDAQMVASDLGYLLSQA
nr:MAG TPA: tail tape measure [Caudoviricetes sp.]